MNLTDAQAKTLPLGDYQDTAQPALRLYVTATTRTWNLYKWSKARGAPVRKKIGTVANMNVIEARKRARDMAAVLEDGKELNTPKSNAVTFRTLVPAYTQSLRTKNKKIPDWCEDAFERHYPDWYDKALTEITKEMVRDRQAKLSTDKGIHAAGRGAKALRALYNYADDEDLYEGKNRGEWAEVAESKPRKRVLTAAEEARVVAALDDEANDLPTYARNLFKLLLATGVRWGNLVEARWEEIDLAEAVWTIPGVKYKNNDDMRVLLSAEAVELMTAQRTARPESPWLFPSPQPNNENHLYEVNPAWQKLMKLAGIEKHATPHDLRRTFGSKQISAGTSLSIVAKMLGHKNSSVTERHYAHVDDAAVREALARVS